MLTAVTRRVSPSFRTCQLEYLNRLDIDVKKAARQHRNYEACLGDLGVRVVSLEPHPELPDSVFVEDPAIVVDEVAVITRMGAETRRAEAESLAAALSDFRLLKWVTAPATIEGGDVMQAGKTLYVGNSRRTNREGVEQLGASLAPFGYRAVPVEVKRCLHLKTGCSWLGGGRVLVNRAWIECGVLSDFEILEVPPEEPWAANVLRSRRDRAPRPQWFLPGPAQGRPGAAECTARSQQPLPSCRRLFSSCLSNHISSLSVIARRW